MGKRYQAGWRTAEIVRRQKAPHLLHLPSLASSTLWFLFLGDQVADAADYAVSKAENSHLPTFFSCVLLPALLWCISKPPGPVHPF